MAHIRTELLLLLLLMLLLLLLLRVLALTTWTKLLVELVGACLHLAELSGVRL